MVNWSNGGPMAIIASFRTTEERLRDVAEQIVRETVDDGLNTQVKLLDTAYTMTGFARVARGGESAGRNETGHMISSIDNDVEVRGDTVSGWWGWENPEPYFLEQDDGEGNIPPADSLVNSFLVTQEKFFERVRDALAGKDI